MVFPARSFTPELTVAVYTLLYDRGLAGVKIAVVPLNAMVQGTVVLPALSTNVIVDWSTASLKVTLRDALTLTFVAPIPGVLAMTAGGVVSCCAPVIKVQV